MRGGPGLDGSRRAGPRVTLQFHPDWPHEGGLVIESMAADLVYRSQFETGVSNGGLTAFFGGGSMALGEQAVRRPLRRRPSV